MGTKLWAVDIILNNLMRPMINAYIFGNYQIACGLLYQLNAFLVGYGQGTDLPTPKSIQLGIMDRTFPGRDYQRYYNMHSPTVLKGMGMYIASVLKTIETKKFMPVDTDTEEIPAELLEQPVTQ
jgi:hypothetical protein